MAGLLSTGSRRSVLMASLRAPVGGVMAAAVLCRRLFSALRLREAAAPKTFRLPHRVPGSDAAKGELLPACASIHTSFPRSGLEEFFDDPKNWGKTEVESGDSWTVEQLRGKSSEDLHKLWYVLLKERNMLLTLEQEAKRQSLPMPSPERLDKVKDSMDRMDLVIQEREDALRLLQTGQEKERPGEWRHNFLGRTFWYEFKEWPIPWYMNRRHNKKRFYFLPRVNHFNRLFLEKYLRKEARRKSLEKKKEQLLQKKFPHLAAQSQS